MDIIEFVFAVLIGGSATPQVWTCIDEEMAQADLAWAENEGLPALWIERDGSGGVSAFGATTAASGLWDEMIKEVLDIE